MSVSATASIRADSLARVRALASEGMDPTEIAAASGLSRAYVYELLDDPDGDKTRVRRDAWRARMSPEQIRAERRRSRTYTTARNREIIQIARERPCVDCGIDWLPTQVMHLDHVRGEKVTEVTFSKTRHWGRAKLEAEIAKCEPRCPTCHAVRHFEQKVNGGNQAIAA